MPSSGSWNNTTYSIPLAGELNWSVLANFLIDLRNNAQTTNFQKVGARIATSTPVTVSSTTDCVIGINIGSASAVNLPAGATGQVFIIADTSGAAFTNNITIDANAAETINGAATYVINRNKGGVTLAWSGTEWTIVSETLAGGLSTGSGNAVLSASPTFTGTLAAAAATLSGIMTFSAEGVVISTGGKGVTFTGGGNTTFSYYDSAALTLTSSGNEALDASVTGFYVRVGDMVTLSLDGLITYSKITANAFILLSGPAAIGTTSGQTMVSIPCILDGTPNTIYGFIYASGRIDVYPSINGTGTFTFSGPQQTVRFGGTNAGGYNEHTSTHITYCRKTN